MNYSSDITPNLWSNYDDQDSASTSDHSTLFHHINPFDPSNQHISSSQDNSPVSSTANSNSNTEPNYDGFMTDFINNTSTQDIFSNDDLFKSPMPSLIENPSVVSTSDEFTPLLSPAVTPFDSVNPGIMPSDFIMPVSYVDGTELKMQQSQQFQKQQTSIQSQPATIQPKRNNIGLAPLVSQSSKVSKHSPSIRPSAVAVAARKLSSAKSSPVITPHHKSSSSSVSTGGSAESISPQETEMLPPPIPKFSSAVTPASLMNLPKSDVEMMDSVETHLRNAVMATKNIATTEVHVNGGKKGKSLTSSPSIRTSRQGSTSGPAKNVIALSPKISGNHHSISPKITTNQSPMIKPKLPSCSAGLSTTIISTSGRRRSIKASPSLMPKLSPHLSPRIESHHRASSANDLSALLASKSNYQNIVEGNHNQLGLSYPEALSADLTSKRTSHKLAEQGRRNRINNALSDLGTMLGPEYQASSKASIVEMAIEYISELKKELDETKKKLVLYEGKERDNNSADDVNS